MQEFIEKAVKLLVDKPDEVNVNIVETEQRIIYELTVGEGDFGKVIGKQGRNISALRTIVFAINAKEGGKRARLDIID
ncbi:MAG: KH domain-containing protein [Candidatus Marinimicrobia bacterium]|jgi:hypothetical protein|nr:KH domain-containing protein [Candidatus Neomarinimicrobiota bacterium]MBT3936178.1 KH domain-containing protein [Candidatus Neomarinimicrobiota bacterium]MBT3960411.1 KH domain-containing protein [Candidatus Neomarinimicrobiota bacterium]MBT4635224.1 KH domain-containing protein [Candidatus Neomarinimicrobiota bacterium]MBT4684302.1 KH domain-containing protein [Candidatus Neomarinimicrobiota bacterium]